MTDVQVLQTLDGKEVIFIAFQKWETFLLSGQSYAIQFNNNSG